MQNTSQTPVVSNSNLATPNNANNTVANTATPTPIPTHQTPKELHLDGWGIAFCFLFIIGLVFSILPWSKSPIEKFCRIDKKHTFRNLFWVIVCGILFVILLFALYRFGLFYPEHNDAGFMFSRVDALILIISIIGIIGAIWAILARVDAEKAFNKSQETLDALGTTFGFSEILNNDKLPEIINSIGKPNRKVSLFIGFPCIGYLYESKDKFRNKPEMLFLDFITKLDYLSNHIDDDDNLKNFYLSLAMFSIADSKELLTDNNKNYSAISNNRRDQIERFYEKIDLLKTKNNPRIIVTEIGLNENLRFASLELENEPSYKSRAIVWIVPDLVDKKEFDSVSFQSSDPKLIAVLKSVFASQATSSIVPTNSGETESVTDTVGGEIVDAPTVPANSEVSETKPPKPNERKPKTSVPTSSEISETKPPDVKIEPS